MKHLSILILAFFLIFIGTWQYIKKEKMTKTFYWSPSAGCAPLYPMETYHCEYIYADGSGDGPATSEVGTRNWGDASGNSLVGDEFKPIPVRLEVTWLSYTENKFYTGNFKLPYDSIIDLFQRGFEAFYWDNENKKAYGKHTTYNEIITGLAPGGIVVVWLSGFGHQIEVARFKGIETIVDMKNFMQRNDLNVTKEEYTKSMLEDQKDVTDNLAKNGIPYGLWDSYRDRFNIIPIVKYDQNHIVKTDKLYMDFLNGESDILFSDKVDNPELKKRARMRNLTATWSDTLGFKIQPYILKINFNEAEMFKAYKEVYGNNPDQKGELVVEVNRGNNQYRIFLQTKDKKVELLEDQGQIYFSN
jgi:hypothetical protein